MSTYTGGEGLIVFTIQERAISMLVHFLLRPSEYRGIGVRHTWGHCTQVEANHTNRPRYINFMESEYIHLTAET